MINTDDDHEGTVTTCQATRYSAGPCSGTPPRFQVTYSTSKGETDSHPACFRHALAEVARHYASAGIARCEIRSLTDPQTQP